MVFDREYSVRSIAVYAALSKCGARYQWGADGPELFDCSGFVLWCWRQAGIKWSDTTAAGLKSLTSPPLHRQAQPGDLAFYGRDGKISHVVMVLSPGGSWIIGANSGTSPLQGESATDYAVRMTKTDACVKIARTVNYRKDLVGLGAMPIEESILVS